MSDNCRPAALGSPGILQIDSSPLPQKLRRYTPLVIALVLAAGYGYLLAWFNRIDFYHRDFFTHGAGVTEYQIARLIFSAYFAWTIYAVGALANHLVCTPREIAGFRAWERVPLFFITGAGIWHVLMFAIGLASFDTKPMALALSLGTVSLSVPHLARCVRKSNRVLSRLQFKIDARFLLSALLWLGIAVSTAAFILTKGLYPGGGHDYYNHYFQFYRRVIETGSILPNDVWYHFYYSAGAGLYFLGMLLTDPLAPQLVGIGFIGCGAVIVYALLRSATRSMLLPLIGVLLYITVFIYTPGPVPIMQNGGWGILQKVHELTAVLILGIVWISQKLFRPDLRYQRSWILALHSAIVCVALLTLPLTLLVGFYLAGCTSWFAAARQWRRAAQFFAAGVTAGICLFVLATINYHYTGFPSVELISEFWPYSNLATVMNWGTLFELLVQYSDATGRAASALPISWETLDLVEGFLKLELWWTLFAAATLLILFRLRDQKSRCEVREQIDFPAWSALVWFGAAVALIGVIGGGRTQPISFYRFSSFSYAPTLCLALMFCYLAVPRRGSTRFWAAGIICALTIVLIDGIERPAVILTRGNFPTILRNSLQLAKGSFSVKDAYQNQQGWAGATPWGGIYPGIIEPWRIAGPGVRIWSFHIGSYCMLPDCNIQEFLSERLSPSWRTVLFGDPEQATKSLQAEGLNYFFFSSEMGMSDPLPHTPLFSPETIDEHLAIRWTDGTSYLLTWPGPDTKPIDRKFRALYSMAASATTRNFNSEPWEVISQYVNRHAFHLRPFRVPWCTNCAGLPTTDE